MLGSTGGWSFIGVLVFLPVGIGLLVLVLIMKGIVKKKTWLIWIVELVVIVLTYVFWLYQYDFIGS